MSTDTEKPGCSYCGFTNQSPYRSDGKTIACDSCFERWRFMGPDAARAKWIIITSRKDFGRMVQATAESLKRSQRLGWAAHGFKFRKGCDACSTVEPTLFHPMSDTPDRDRPIILIHGDPATFSAGSWSLLQQMNLPIAWCSEKNLIARAKLESRRIPSPPESEKSKCPR